ncbi:MAG: diacylglycerol kinase family protein [Ruminococcus sp.]|nr:diacylglycerol kinase family protein [Ruminococcus sp.]
MKKQIRSFGFALSGLWNAIRTEAHLRFHLVAGVWVFIFAFLGEFSLTQWAVLCLTVSAVISAELVNTAAEDLCDLYTREQKPEIKRIKDISAAAVLVFALGAVCVAVVLFILTGNLQAGFEKLINNPVWFIPLGFLAVLSVLFVLFGGKQKNKI